MAPRGPYRAATYLGALRVRLGLTQAEAAKRLGVSRAYLAALEQGAARPSTSLRDRMARLYRLPGRELARLVSLTRHFGAEVRG